MADTIWTREAPTEPGLYWVMRYGSSKPIQARFRYRGGPGGQWVRVAIAGRGSYPVTTFFLFGPPVAPPDGWQAVAR